MLSVSERVVILFRILIHIKLIHTRDWERAVPACKPTMSLKFLYAVIVSLPENSRTCEIKVMLFLVKEHIFRVKVNFFTAVYCIYCYLWGMCDVSVDLAIHLWCVLFITSCRCLCVCRREKGFTVTCHTRICSLHFPNGKNSGPELFPWNDKKLFQIKSPEKKQRQQRKAVPELCCTYNGTSVSSPLDTLADAAATVGPCSQQCGLQFLADVAVRESEPHSEHIEQLQKENEELDDSNEIMQN